jgi:hypothetical protein
MNRSDRRRAAAQNRHRPVAMVELPKESAEVLLAELPSGGVKLSIRLAGSRVLATVELDAARAIAMGEALIEIGAKPTAAELAGGPHG